MFCTEKERKTCNVEKMGCEGCYYSNDTNILEGLKNVDLIELLRTFKREGIKNFIVVRRNKFESIINRYKELEIENNNLKEDIKNMYDEEVIINIISDEFNLSRSEVLEILGESED